MRFESENEKHRYENEGFRRISNDDVRLILSRKLNGAMT